MTNKFRTEQPIHHEIKQAVRGWWIPAQAGGSLAGWESSAPLHVDAAMEHVRGVNVAIQAGCHIGLWARYLATLFDRVWTFEADPVNYRCAAANVEGYTNITLTKAALGAKSGTLPWSRSISNTGKHKVDQLGKGSASGAVEVVTIDSLNLRACDLICLDIEGFELAALKGATATVAEHRPVILFEDAGHARWHGLPPDGVPTWLTAMGYAKAATIDDDQIWVPQ